MQVTISKGAADGVSRRGGRLCVWGRPFSRRNEIATLRWSPRGFVLEWDDRTSIGAGV